MPPSHFSPFSKLAGSVNLVEGNGEGEVVVFSDKRWTAEAEAASPSHDVRVAVLELGLTNVLLTILAAISE